uniref:Uncharacterized protein n=1 Tax=Curvibacter symbiont subsp. Hydra magnipapillata TaxID=667019 RepID=C9Y6Q3_CURXX|nr:hypothetical protein Csp_E36300 [Curvibacter putative symbiont of Hydra magnipapillata]
MTCTVASSYESATTTSANTHTCHRAAAVGASSLHNHFDGLNMFTATLWTLNSHFFP